MALYRGTYRIQATRLPGWDYAAPAWYFVTNCTKGRTCLFGTIRDGTPVLSDIGMVAHRHWAAIADHVPDEPKDDPDVETRRGASPRVPPPPFLNSTVAPPSSPFGQAGTGREKITRRIPQTVTPDSGSPAAEESGRWGRGTKNTAERPFERGS